MPASRPASRPGPAQSSSSSSTRSRYPGRRGILVRMANVRSDVRPLHLRWQPTLMSALGDAPAFDPSFASARRVALDDAAWVEHAPGWVNGSETLFEDIVEHAPWEHRTVRMYDRMVDEPRLTAWYGQSLAD